MPERLALIGFVNSEQVIADTVKQQTPNVTVDGYVLFPNRAFERLVDNAYKLYEEDDERPNDSELSNLANRNYDGINLGPDTAVLLLEDRLLATGANYTGARIAELAFELDKTKIFEIFPSSSGIMPTTQILEASDEASVKLALEKVNKDAVVKFVGDYADHYEDSEYRRVRFLSEFDGLEELREFVSRSIVSSGKAIIQERVSGQEFSYTCVVDENSGQFRLGENIFYKKRHEGDQGPLCDGTGSISIGNTLPGIVTADDIDFIEKKIVKRYVEKIAEKTGRAPRTFLNIDLMKDEKGRVYLIEVNHRQPGGHTMSTLLAGLETPISEVLFAAQEDRLDEIEPRFKKGATVAVTVFPEISPRDFNETDQRPLVDIPHNRPEDKTRLYTGWVNVLDENHQFSRVESNLTATIIATTHEASLKIAREATYERISKLALNNSGLTYRRDIGIHVQGLVEN
jgi:phosphoribosylamine-glycine ligase